VSDAAESECMKRTYPHGPPESDIEVTSQHSHTLDQVYLVRVFSRV